MTRISILYANNYISVFMAILFFIVFMNLNIDLSFVGGGGDFSIIPKTIAVLILFIILSRSKLKYRYILYLLILAIFMTFSFQSKREALLLIFPVVLLEFYNKKFTFKLSNVIYAVLIGVLVIYSVLLMSIARGYGSYNVNTVWEASRYVSDYMKHENFIPYFMNNIEVSSAFLHSNLAVNYVLKNPSLITYGSTIIKFIFIPIPRSVFPYKPNSMVHLFTQKFDPEFRKAGGSHPVSIQSEMFWNFHFFGLIAILLFFVIFNYLYRLLLIKITNNTIIDFLPLLYGYMILIYIIRGNGFDAFFVYFILGCMFYFLYKVILRILENGKKLLLDKSSYHLSE